MCLTKDKFKDLIIKDRHALNRIVIDCLKLCVQSEWLKSGDLHYYGIVYRHPEKRFTLDELFSQAKKNDFVVKKILVLWQGNFE